MCNQQNYPFFRHILEESEVSLLDTTYDIDLTTRQVFIDRQDLYGSIQGVNLHQFNKTALHNVWLQEIPTSVKFILTFLWGGMTVNDINVMLADPQFEQKCESIQQTLQNLSDRTDSQSFKVAYTNQFDMILRNPARNIPNMGTVFLSKIAFFYYWSHPNQVNFIPMIIDRHIANALHADIILSNNNTRYNFLGNRGVVVNSVEQHNGYINYFYDAVESLIHNDFPNLTVPILESRLWIRDVHYPTIDPRREAKRIINNNR